MYLYHFFMCIFTTFFILGYNNKARGVFGLNAKILATLEYAKIITMLAQQASTSIGKELAELLMPSTELEEVKQHLTLTDEAATVYRLKGLPPFTGIKNIESSLKRARIHALLNGQELYDIATSARASRHVKRFLEQVKDDAPIPQLLLQVEMIAEHRHIEEAIFQAIDEQGYVLDQASVALAQARREIRNGEARVREKLETMIRSSSVQKMLQEAIITIRNDRFVIPIKAEYRSHFGGIIHDQSGSGATLFVEPEIIVTMNNKIRELKLQEEREVEKVLQQLTAIVSDVVEDYRFDQQKMAFVDFCFAKAKLAHVQKAVRPMMNDRGYIKIIKGRHPLIETTKVVPLDLELGNQYQSIIVTGPNTGGKTVSLKTVGLLSLMAMSGLFVPSNEQTQLCVFDAIFADIGDEQSIEQNLSTFSSHMTNIIRILDEMTEKSLVLLDELGAGTDPAEGSALAIAILEHIISKGCRTIATTHYSELKAYAFDRQGVINASMEFDVATLSPTYRLLVGVPGRSNAFAIAERLGLNMSIIQKAKVQVSDEDLKVDNMIASLEENRISAEAQRQEAEQLRLEMEKLRKKLDDEKKRFEEQKHKLLQKAEQDAREAVTKARKEADEVIQELRKLAMEEGASIKEHKLIEVKKKLEQAEPELVEGKKRSASAKKQKLNVGDDVLVFSLNSKGSILELHKDYAVVQLGIMQMKVKLDDMELIQAASKAKEAPKKAPGAMLKRNKDEGIKLELDLRGEALDEAIMEVDRFIDDAYLDNMGQVYIIHGKGTGILRTGIQEFLRRHKLVKAYRDGAYGEGGNGVTVVQLK